MNMPDPLKIIAADDEPRMQAYFQRILPLLGHQVIGVAGNGKELVELCQKRKPDLVITDIRMSELDGLAAIKQINEQTPIPVILVSAFQDRELIKRAEEEYVMAYLIKPIKQDDLEPAIALAVTRFKQFEELRREASSLHQALEDRKDIERAKGILMEKTGRTEHEAFRRLQKLARDSNQKLVAVARMILTAKDTL